MQVFGLPGHLIRNGRRASRLIDAQPPSSAAAIRGDALTRWRRAMAKGLTAEEAAEIVAVPRSTLYRWAKAVEPKSRRPHRVRWTHHHPEYSGQERRRHDRVHGNLPFGVH